MLIDFSRNIVRSRSLSWFQFAKSVVEFLHGKWGIDGAQCGLGCMYWDGRVLRGESDLVGEIAGKSLSTLRRGDQFTPTKKRDKGRAWRMASSFGPLRVIKIDSGG